MKGPGSQIKTQTGITMLNNRGGFFTFKNTRGYTIVEVMVFLAVTSLLFAMIATTFSRRQGRQEFSVAARDMESRLQDIANDVSTGFYSNPGTFRCTTPGGIPDIDPIPASAGTQGTNEDCIYIGRAAQFDLANGDGGNNRYNYNLYSIVGARQTTSGDDVMSYAQANPRTITSPPQGVDLTQNVQLPAGLRFARMHVRSGGTYTPIRGVAFISTFGDDAANSGSLSVNVLPLAVASSNNAKSTVVDSVSNLASTGGTGSNPEDGIYICFNGDNSDQYAEYHLGGSNARLTTSLEIREGSCPSV